MALSLEKGIQEYSGKKENIPGKVHLTKKIFAPEAFLTVNTARGKYFFIICIFSLISILDRSNRLQMFFKMGVIKNFKNFTRRNTCFGGLWACDFIKKRLRHRFKACNLNKKKLQHRYFSVKFAKFSRTHFFQSNPGGCF